MTRPSGSAIAPDSRNPAVTRKMLMPASLSNPPSRSHMPNRRTTAPGPGKNKGSTSCSAVTAHQAASHKQKLVAAIDRYSFRLTTSDRGQKRHADGAEKAAGTISRRRYAAVALRQHTAHAMPVIAAEQLATGDHLPILSAVQGTMQ